MLHLVAIHPQLLLQLSEQFTRRPFLTPPPPQQFSLGVILGSAEGARVEAFSAVEVRVVEKSGTSLGYGLDGDNYHGLLRLHQQIYKDEKPIGWYSCEVLSPDHARIFHSLFEPQDYIGPFIRAEFVERDQPLALFMQRGDSWVSIEYTYETAPAERIAMMQLQSEGNAESQVAFTADAYMSLNEDLGKIEAYVTKVANNELPFDSVLVRRCAEIAQWWEHKTEGEDQDKIMEEENLGLLVGILAQRLTAFATTSGIQVPT
jgi:hypothetical protein